jgi:glyoxylase-like metal-dependent hydrolase (beta-lactamase superfamily II)
MTPIAFIKEFDPAHGTLVSVTPLIRRLVAKNSGPFTAWGTGTYVVGHGEVAVIDPGPLDDAHIDALLAALGGERISHLVITHTHLDHSPAAAVLHQRCGAMVIGCGPHGEHGETTEAGADYDYRPERQLHDGGQLAGRGWTLTAVATPGHTSNHLCYCLEEEGALFTGDHVMGWSTTVVSPPDGDMQAYMASLERLIGRADRTYYPTHGEREAQVLACLTDGLDTIAAMVARLYAAVDVRLHHAAGRSVLAHLQKLLAEGRVVADAGAGDTRYRLA